jgi:molecular chaperone HtpG
MATIGKNILDNLTTGMYSDSKVIYREYIQNACDQIDLAVKHGVITKEEASVDIFIDSSKRYICIEDNATGVDTSGFISNLGDIANSNKEMGKNKGFRGIGRLCGLAYCKTLKFTTSYKGEAKRSIMICDAKKMREMLIENKKYTIDEIWEAIVKFEVGDEDTNKHYFKVELIDINKENTDLLDGKKVRDYLSFVAPVPYKTPFFLSGRIYEYAKKLGYVINEYSITVNGLQIFKEYTTKLKEQNGNNLKNYDEITDLEFQDFTDADGNLLAWMWIGLSRFEKSIPRINQMRGLRLRSENIQLGNDDCLQELFKETRGNYYFVGEVFAVSKALIPNSQRDYFNENETRVRFEDELRNYFYDVLHKLYTDANRIKNAYKRQEEFIFKKEEFEKKVKENGFVDEEEKQRLQFDVEKSRKTAEDARKQLNKFDNLESSSPISVVSKSIGRKFNANELTKKAESIANVDLENQEKKKSYITSTMSKLSRSERKLVSRILSIITDNAPKEVAEQIIDKIKEELK